MTLDRVTLPSTIRSDPHLAHEYTRRIEELINDFADKLKDDEGMAVFVILNDGTRLDASWFGFYNPDMIIVAGVDGSGEVEALLPKTDIQILITRVKKSGTRHIGFQPIEKSS